MAAAAAAAAAVPAALIRGRSAAPLLVLHRRARNPKTPLRRSAASLHPLPRSPPPPPPPLIPNAASSRWRWRRRLFCRPAAEGGEGVREFRRRLRIADVKGGASEGVGWGGWGRSSRSGDGSGLVGCRVEWSIVHRVALLRKGLNFIILDLLRVNDGSCLSNMQCVMIPDAEGYDQVELRTVTAGASVLVEGVVVSSQGAKQKVEVKVARLVMIGKCDPLTYPIQKKRASREFLRTIAHLRPRTNTFGSVTRVRNALAYATHKFFQENGFVWISSPIITASDCEGVGEQFCMSNTRESNDCPITTIPTTKDGKDFFGKPAFLTVSGQLNAETYASSLSDVYTFDPTFRAENSNTSRHLAEFWMIEPELAFADLNDDMACATAYLQYVVKFVLENCKEDMDFFNTWIEKGIIDRLNNVAEKNFVQLTYSDAIELLLRAERKFDFPVKWGLDLQSEHERYITEIAFGGRPVITRDYPKEIKAFYMRQNDDGKTVAAMDLLVPRVGELIGGSQRDERLDYLEARLDELNLNKENYWWYLDLRRFGSVPHAGFGLGFERLVQFATGIENIRDAIPFPRTPGSTEF
ncbi:Asparagine--tRNA ligase, chloroplastic/mitochondrial [Ananas comosus]|uniref:asparagine--tRNA ligase n=1 Tax=Ananas comosus TaxID=4615 RepID=A0A199VF71_ANACO|nr:Asparagine--tRNA ligase, chloroplastic/mitochondrial [Ananas comosus]